MGDVKTYMSQEFADIQTKIEEEKPHAPAKVRIIGARGNGKSSVAERLIVALVRADVYQYVNHITQELHFISKNTEEPLNDQEKELLTHSLGIHMCPYKVVYDN